MAIPQPQSLKWPADRAVLLVHGVGSSKPGDYDPLVAQVTNILAAGKPQRYAVYMLYYDYLNEWFSEKIQSSLALNRLIGAIRSRTTDPALGNTIADFGGDVIWPILSLDARDAMRTALLRQIRQMWMDGATAGIPIPQRHISIICHSMGCFHVYEALYEAATNPAEQLGPNQGVQIDNVIFMASPVQLIRTVGGDIRDAVPNPDSLACLSAAPLDLPSQSDGFGGTVPYVKQVASICGNLDPVGGYFFRARQDWAYMNLPNQISRIDQQEWVDMKESDLQAILQDALKDGGLPKITPNNPHDWTGYVTRHAEDLVTWLP